jgi:hypothetical protein
MAQEKKKGWIIPPEFDIPELRRRRLKFLAELGDVKERNASHLVGWDAENKIHRLVRVNSDGKLILTV